MGNLTINIDVITPVIIPGKKTCVSKLVRLCKFIPPSGTRKWKNNSSPLKLPYVSNAQYDAKKRENPIIFKI